MNKFKLIKTVLVILMLFAMLFTVSAVEEQDPIPVFATFSYTWSSPMMAQTSSYIVQHGIEPEVWSGDFEGTADAIWRVGFYSNEPLVDVWLLSEFTGTMLGEYEGTATMILVGDQPNVADSPWKTQWYGEWAIIDGTGDLANVHGHGVWWGPGNGPNADLENEVDEIALAGEIVFMEPPSN